MLKLSIAAGHGLNTPGKRLPAALDRNQTREWTLNDRVLRFVLQELRNYVDVDILRLDDPTGRTDIGLANRAAKANNWKADFHLDIHHNGGANLTNAGGIEVYAWSGNVPQRTLNLQKNLYEKLIQTTGLKGNRANPLGRANFQILRTTKMPALLAELGYMDSRVDAPIILTEKFAKDSAKGIVAFLEDSFGIKKAPTPDKSGSDGLIRVQTGAFKNRQGALNLERDLKRKGFATYVTKDGDWHKVQVGAFANMKNAQTMANRLKAAGYDTYIPKEGNNLEIKPAEIKTGDRVRVQRGATFADGQSIASFVFNRVHTVQSLRNGIAVIAYKGTVVGRVRTSNLAKA